MKGIKIDRLKVHRDPRGIIFEPLPSRMLRGGKLMNVHVATMRPGAVRGNHRHLAATEFICFSGPMRIVVQDQRGRQKQLQFRVGECVRVRIAPGVAHAFVNIGERGAFIVCFSDRTEGSNKKERVPLISEIGHC